MLSDLSNSLKNQWAWSLLCLLLVVAGSFGVMSFYQALPAYSWIFFFLPALSLLLAFLLIKSYDTLFWVAVIFTPLSLSVLAEQSNLGLSLPNEPVIVLLMGAVFIKAIMSPVDRRVIFHPVSIGVFIYLAWIFLTSFSSTMPLVSFKFFLSRIWYVAVFYFFGISLFSRKKNISRFIWLYSLPLAITVISTLINHKESSFDRDASFYVMAPFFIDHGIYAATIAFMIPPVLLLAFSGRRLGQPAFARLCALGLSALLLLGIVFSFTRAAWLSLAVATALSLVMLLRIRLWFIIVCLGFAAVTYTFFQDDIAVMLSRNKQASSGSGFDRQVKSITNVSNDNSNLERINRWNSAIGMWQDKPWTGYGPGTYIFKYAPYQNSAYLTPISTNFGDGGNAHSEYLNPLAETGLPGMLSVLLFLFLLVRTGMRLVYDARMRHVRMLAWGILLGLITYYAHGILNNYSDSDKTLVLIWSFAGMLVALDIKEKKERINPSGD